MSDIEIMRKRILILKALRETLSYDEEITIALDWAIKCTQPYAEERILPGIDFNLEWNREQWFKDNEGSSKENNPYDDQTGGR